MLAGVPGCRGWFARAPQTPPGQSPLRPTGLAADGVSLEVLFVRFPAVHAELNTTLWNDIDETQLAPALRRELAANGLRGGVISGQLPPALAQHLIAADASGNRLEAAQNAGGPPPVVKQQLNMHSGGRGEIVASAVYPTLPLLARENDQCCGQTFTQAQGVLAAKATALGDRRVTLQLTPELHHGQAQQNWIGDDGMFRLQSGKPKRAFDKLAIEATLAPGQVLILGALPERPGTLGHYFLTEPTPGELAHKLVMVRLAESRHSNLFSPSEIAAKQSAEKATLYK